MSVRIKNEEQLGVVQSTEHDDDDQVVREIDVFLSPALTNLFHLLQYPLQHTPVTHPSAARIKHRHGILELDQPLPMSIERSGLFHMQHRTYRSQTVPVQTHVCMGKLQDDPLGKTSLHLVPLTHASQMRPTFQHVDAMDDPHAELNIEEDDDVDDDKTMEKKPVVFQRKESERAAIARKSSYAFKKASEEGEEWQQLEVSLPDTELQRTLLNDVVCADLGTFALLPSEQQASLLDPDISYVNSLDYMPPQAGQLYAHLEGKDIKTVVSKLTVLMTRGWPIPYSILRAQFSSQIADEALLHALSVCAVMVRGIFCLNSKLLNLDEPLQRARTFILYLLHSHGSIYRTKLDRVFDGYKDVSSQRLLEILKQVGKKIQSCWVLKVPDDEHFLKDYAATSALHELYWQRQSIRYSSLLQVYNMP
jgi:DNA-directed RNA polymerase-3 subunit RPC5